MAIEIQSFILARNIDAPPKRLPTLLDAGIYEMFPANGQFPVVGKLPFFLVLRKDSRASKIDFRGQIKIINPDGATINPPGVLNVKGTFPSGYRFWKMNGAMKFEFAGPGSYSVMLDIESEGSASQFRYDIDVAGSQGRSMMDVGDG